MRDKNKLSLLFGKGLLVKATVVPARFKQDHWMLQVETVESKQIYLSRVGYNEVKIYRNLTAALEDGKRIGFKEANIEYLKTIKPSK